PAATTPASVRLLAVSSSNRGRASISTTEAHPASATRIPRYASGTSATAPATAAATSNGRGGRPARRPRRPRSTRGSESDTETHAFDQRRRLLKGVQVCQVDVRMSYLIQRLQALRRRPVFEHGVLERVLHEVLLTGV